MKALLIITLFTAILFISCQNRKDESSKRNINNNENVFLDNNEDSTPFEDAISLISEIKLPDTIYCGIESSIPVNEFGDLIIKTSPKPIEWTGIYGKFSPREDKIYIIYSITGDINYPYLYTYDKNGILIDSLYLHIGVCVGDESAIMSNTTFINKDYSINMVDTTQYIHYNEQNQIFVDSIVILKRKLKLNSEGLYHIVNTDKRVLLE